MVEKSGVTKTRSKIFFNHALRLQSVHPELCSNTCAIELSQKRALHRRKISQSSAFGANGLGASTLSQSGQNVCVRAS